MIITSTTTKEYRWENEIKKHHNHTNHLLYTAHTQHDVIQPVALVHNFTASHTPQKLTQASLPLSSIYFTAFIHFKNRTCQAISPSWSCTTCPIPQNHYPSHVKQASMSIPHSPPPRTINKCSTSFALFYIFATLSRYEDQCTRSSWLPGLIGIVDGGNASDTLGQKQIPFCRYILYICIYICSFFYYLLT